MEVMASSAGASHELTMKEVYQRLPMIIKRPVHATVGVSVHFFKVGILVVALAGCVAAYCIAIVWICLFWFQTKLLIITAALLQSCLEEQPTHADTGSPATVQEPLKEIPVQTVHEGRDELVKRIKQRERDVEEDIARAAHHEASTVDEEDWSVPSDEAQTEFGEYQQDILPPPAVHGPPLTSVPEAEQAKDLAIATTTDQQDARPDQEQSAPLKAMQLEASEAQQPTLPAGVHRGATRKTAAEPKPAVSKEERKAQVQTAWLSSMNSSTTAATPKTTAVRTTGFSAEQIAEASSFMKGATRGGAKQKSKLHGSTRTAKSPVAATFKPRHADAGPEAVRQSAPTQPEHEHRRGDSATTVPPHLRKAREVRESRESRASAENAQIEPAPVATPDKQALKENKPPRERARSHTAQEQEEERPVLTCTAHRADNDDEEPGLAPVSAGRGTHAETSADDYVAATKAMPAPSFVLSAETQTMKAPAAEGKDGQHETMQPVHRGIFEFDMPKSFNVAPTSAVGAEVERAETQTMDSPASESPDGQHVTMQPMHKGIYDLDTLKSLNVAPTSAVGAEMEGAQQVIISNTPSVSLTISSSHEHTKAVEKAVEVLNEQANRRRKTSLATREQRPSEASPPTEQGIMQDPAIIFASSERTAPVSNGYAHSDLLDLDFTAPPTSLARVPALQRRESSLHPTAPPFFAPSLIAVSSSAQSIHYVEERASCEEADDVYESASYPGWAGGFNAAYGQQHAKFPHGYPNGSSQGQFVQPVPAYGPQQAPARSPYPDDVPPDQYIPQIPNARQPVEALLGCTGADDDASWTLSMTVAEGASDHQLPSGQRSAGTTTFSRAVPIVGFPASSIVPGGQEGSASSIPCSFGEEVRRETGEQLSDVSPTSDVGTQLGGDETTPVNAKKALKEKKQAARYALLAAWYEREAARKKVKGTFSLEGMRALEAATTAYNDKRSGLQHCMGNGVLNEQDAEHFPILSINDLAAPKQRPAGAEEAYREQKAAEEVPKAAEATDDEPAGEQNKLREEVYVALKLYDDTIAYFKRRPPQGRKDARVLLAEGKAKIERGRTYYRKKRDALERRFPHDPWLLEYYEPDPWLGFEAPDVHGSR
ncbi:hypothetical protein LTR36_002721 [Oleoguttula mirabilis]|uniref:Transmembrane protein n=1 Tax=Oleoguttula mirabilis TaxID=1507867 RepID=A0AAV9JKD1_9PEZI|nr:hypothetical protein LTR36_002721 [Oleoguttula mirabilis]